MTVPSPRSLLHLTSRGQCGIHRHSELKSELELKSLDFLRCVRFQRKTLFILNTVEQEEGRDGQALDTPPFCTIILCQCRIVQFLSASMLPTLRMSHHENCELLQLPWLPLLSVV